jgi:hypothetical protein
VTDVADLDALAAQCDAAAAEKEEVARLMRAEAGPVRELLQPLSDAFTPDVWAGEAAARTYNELDLAGYSVRAAADDLEVTADELDREAAALRQQATAYREEARRQREAAEAAAREEARRAETGSR